MGEAFDRAGRVLGDAFGETKREVFEKLTEAHPEAAEIRVRSVGVEGRLEAAVADIEKTFTYHKPFGSQPQRYEMLRTMAKNLAYNIHQACPPSRERSLALTNLQQAIMWANASIAVNESDEEAAGGTLTPDAFLRDGQ